MLAQQALQQKMHVRMPERNVAQCLVNSNSCARESERSEPMLKGDRTSFTDRFSIIKVMVSILNYVFIKSCFTYYVVFCRITEFTPLLCHVGVYRPN